MRALWTAVVAYLVIGVVYAIWQNLLPGGPAYQAFGGDWWDPVGWWNWFLLPALTWPLLVWRTMK